MLSSLADTRVGKQINDDSTMDQDSKYCSQIFLEIFNYLRQRQDDSYYDPSELTVDENNCFSCPQLNKPPPPYPFHRYAPDYQTSSMESIYEENISWPSSSNLWSDYELTSIRPFVEWDGTSDSEQNAPLPPPPYPKATNQDGTEPGSWSGMDWPTRQPPPYEAPNGLRSGWQPPTAEGSTLSFFPETVASRLHYSQPRLDRDTDMNDNDEDLRKLPGETVKDTILRCFSGKKKNKLTSGGSPVLWQFIIDLLADPANSNIIYWQGDDGTFVIADRNKMAYRWGKEKAKKSDSETTMSYEKLSRSLRYYYNKNFLRKVTGERYAYQFHLPGLFNLVKLTRRISDAEFIQERFEVTSENINSLNVASFDRVWEDS